jgi:hypothetical protein
MSFTRFLMSASALSLGLLGIVGSFMPDEVLGRLGAPVSPLLMLLMLLVLLVQVLGALYMGFAALNWMVRDNLIGGIYSRPVAVGNLLHFLTAGLAMLKLLVRAPKLQLLWPLALVYTVFAAGFAVVLFRHPIRSPSPGAEPNAHA